MIYLVTGGSGSGKSAYGEKLAVKQYKEAQKIYGETSGLYYVATMYPYDGESRKRIERHRRMRDGKGFQTVECFHHLKMPGNDCENLSERNLKEKGNVYLLECMSNLLANEMYMEEGQIKGNSGELHEKAKEAIITPIKHLAQNAHSLIIITNEVFSDGNYSEKPRNTSRHKGVPETGENDGTEDGTYRYCRLLGEINCLLAKEAEAVVEVVCGIPVCRKGELPC